MDEKRNIFEINMLNNQIVAWCQETEAIIYEKSFSSVMSKTLFSTENLDSVFGVDGENGLWKCGRFLVYQIEINEKTIDVFLASQCKGLKKDSIPLYQVLLESFSEKEDCGNYFKLVNLFSFDRKTDFNEIKRILSLGFKNKILSFESQLKVKIDIITKELHEGAEKEVLSNKYERNPEARRKCLEHHGYYCHICGFDPVKIYGEAFKNKIEVHHIVPLSQIKADYVVDPINDLIPVCPNCHTILHSKPGGVYTPDEVKNFLKKTSE